MAKVFLSLGSSLGDRKNILDSSIRDIDEKIGEILEVSSIYESEPWGFEDENCFLNMAILVESNLHPYTILDKIHSIESKFRRVRTGNGYQSRTLDIDIIFYDDKIYYSDDLQIPHKHAHERKFVLLPIAEIQPDLIHPLFNQSISELAENCIDKTLITVL